MSEVMSPPPLAFEAMERLYENLADAVDRAGPDNEALFLTKLVLVMAHRAGTSLDMDEAIATALARLGEAAKPPYG